MSSHKFWSIIQQITPFLVTKFLSSLLVGTRLLNLLVIYGSSSADDCQKICEYL